MINCLLCCVFYFVGIIASIKLVINLVLNLIGGLGSPKEPRSYGTWAVVTGATDGIGKALALEFARKGMNVFLISRSESKLVATAEALAAESGGSIETRHLTINYSKFDVDTQSKVAEALSELPDVGILVNNVGVSYPFPLFFHELSDVEVNNLLEVNMKSTTIMSRIVLPLMLKRNKGLIMNIGSAAGLQPSPLLAMYGASKSYVEALGHSLNTEYASKGICVQTHVPNYIVSNLSKIRKPSAFVPSAETYAKEVVASLGKGGPVVSPHFLHRMAAMCLDMAPQVLLQQIQLKFLLPIRSKGLKKRAREEEAKDHSS